jgi:glucose/arabinose dehydrogenase
MTMRTDLFSGPTRIALAALAGGTLAVAPASAQTLVLEPVTTVSRPVFVTHAPGDDALYIIEQRGAIRIYRNGALLATPFLDIDADVTGGTSGGDERGLLGLAFAPDYATSGRFFVNYTGTPVGAGLTTFVREYLRSGANPSVANPASARTIISFAQPFSNHNAGWMGFSPTAGDFNLYVATGDGGSGGDPNNAGQTRTTLLGKMLRLDVSNSAVAYTIPSDNPFFGNTAWRQEIWASGLRNPWRTSFDRENGDLWIADVGQNNWEEINRQLGTSAGGENYGWKCREGFNVFDAGCNSNGVPFTDPVHEYGHNDGRCSVTGGYVYRGCELGADLQGKYIFGDYCSGEIWALDPADNSVALLGQFDFGLSSFGEGPDGELYVTFLFDNAVFKLTNSDIGDADADGILDPCDCAADLTGDGEVDSGDLSLFVTAFLAGDAGVADLTGDGQVDSGDLGLFIQLFLAGC